MPALRRRPSAYADPTMEMLLEDLRPAVERATEMLFPTYSYFRVISEATFSNVIEIGLRAKSA
jgi:hypothetical protein